MDRLLDLSDQLAAAVQRAGQSVLAVHGRPRMPSTGIHWRAGLIVTANHTLQADEDLTVTSPTGESSRVTVVGRDPGLDVAILRIDVAGHGRSRCRRLRRRAGRSHGPGPGRRAPRELGRDQRDRRGVVAAHGRRSLQPGSAPLSRVLRRAAGRCPRRGRRRQHVGRLAAPAPGHSGERGESRRRRRGPSRPGAAGLPRREHAADPGAGGRARATGVPVAVGRSSWSRSSPGVRRRPGSSSATSSWRSTTWPSPTRSIFEARCVPSGSVSTSRRRCSERAACSR